MTPFIEQMIIENFGREIQVDKRDNPMESVAVGAAFMAFMKVNQNVNQVKFQGMPQDNTIPLFFTNYWEG